MLLLRVYEQWRGISFLRDHFSAVARGRKFCVIILIYLGSAFVCLCRCVLVCGRQLMLWCCVENVIICCEGTDALA